MTLAIQCTACGKGFNISPDVYERRVRGKVVRLKCKQCGAPIEIDAREEGKPAGQPEPMAAKAATKPAAVATQPEVKPEPATAAKLEPTAERPAAPLATSATNSAAATAKAAPAAAQVGLEPDRNLEPLAAVAATKPAAVATKKESATEFTASASTNTEPLASKAGPGATRVSAPLSAKTATKTAATASKPEPAPKVGSNAVTKPGFGAVKAVAEAAPKVTPMAVEKPEAAGTKVAPVATSIQPAPQATSPSVPERRPFAPGRTSSSTSKITNPAVPAPQLKRDAQADDAANAQGVVARPAPAAAQSQWTKAAQTKPEERRVLGQLGGNRPKSPIGQLSYRRATPAASPSAIRASQRPLPPDVSPPLVAVNLQATAGLGAARTAAQPAIAEDVGAHPELEELPVESLWAVDLGGEDAELTQDDLIGRIQAGRVSATTLVWRIGMAEWKRVEEVDELRFHLAAPPLLERDPLLPGEFASVDELDEEEATVAFPHPARQRRGSALPNNMPPLPAGEALPPLAVPPIPAVTQPAESEEPAPPPLPRSQPTARARIDAFFEDKSRPPPPSSMDDSITRTQTDIFGIAHSSTESSEAARALRTLKALESLNRAQGAAPALPEPIVSASSDSDAPRFRRTPPLLWMLGGIVTVCAIVVVVILMNRSGSTPPAVSIETRSTATAPQAEVAKSEPTGATELAAAAENDRPEPAPDSPSERPAMGSSEEATEHANAPSPSTQPGRAPSRGDGDFLSMFSAAAHEKGGISLKPFDPTAALTALKGRLPVAHSCDSGRTTPVRLQVVVTFDPGNGHAAGVQVLGDGPEPLKRCVSGAMSAAKVTPFAGKPSSASLNLSL